MVRSMGVTKRLSRKFSMETFWTPSFSVQVLQKTVTPPQLHPHILFPPLQYSPCTSTRYLWSRLHSRDGVTIFPFCTLRTPLYQDILRVAADANHGFRHTGAAPCIQPQSFPPVEGVTGHISRCVVASDQTRQVSLSPPGLSPLMVALDS
jgi:hypothetical protein